MQFLELESNDETTAFLCKDKIFRVHMILRVKEKLQGHLKIKKRHGVVMFVSINEVKNFILQPLTVCVQHKRRSSFR